MGRPQGISKFETSGNIFFLSSEKRQLSCLVLSQQIMTHIISLALAVFSHASETLHLQTSNDQSYWFSLQMLGRTGTDKYG